ncbi:hypothetical protein FO519_002263 [Halicephalobus sp. NKZ332]|nr:hypothetical protein FO519_002263 [Halicephalobus sp. NKZ332]
MCFSAEPVDFRKLFLVASITLTVFGCFVSAFSIGLVQWQVVEMREFNSIHEHGIFWDCVSSESIPLTAVRNPFLEDDEAEYASRWRRKCVYKFDESATQVLHTAIGEGDAASREYLLHRFLPQHKAVVFFTVFTFIFAGMSIIIGGCSTCFIPNGILHVISVIITLFCSLFGDVIFFLASMRIDNRYVHGIVDQRIGYAFYVHLLAAGVFFLAVVSAIIAAYLLLKEDFLINGCCGSKSDSPKYFGEYPPSSFETKPIYRSQNSRNRPAAMILDHPEELEDNIDEVEQDSSRWRRRPSYERSIPFVVQK